MVIKRDVSVIFFIFKIYVCCIFILLVFWRFISWMVWRVKCMICINGYIYGSYSFCLIIGLCECIIVIMGYW